MQWDSWDAQLELDSNSKAVFFLILPSSPNIIPLMTVPEKYIHNPVLEKLYLPTSKKMSTSFLVHYLAISKYVAETMFSFLFLKYSYFTDISPKAITPHWEAPALPVKWNPWPKLPLTHQTPFSWCPPITSNLIIFPDDREELSVCCFSSDYTLSVSCLISFVTKFKNILR